MNHLFQLPERLQTKFCCSGNIYTCTEIWMKLPCSWYSRSCLWERMIYIDQLRQRNENDSIYLDNNGTSSDMEQSDSEHLSMLE